MSRRTHAYTAITHGQQMSEDEEEQLRARSVYNNRFVCLDGHRDGGYRHASATAEITGTASQKCRVLVGQHGENGELKTNPDAWRPDVDVKNNTIQLAEVVSDTVCCQHCGEEMLDTKGMTDREVQNEIHKKLAREL